MTAPMTVSMLKVAELHPDPANPRNNTAAIEKVAASIREFGFKVPLVVNSEHKIIAGHTRYLAALMLKLDEIPCIVADDLDAQQQNGFAVAENRTSDFSFFDLEKLAQMDLDDQYIAEFDLDALLDGLDMELPDEEAQAPKTPEKREGLDLAPFEKYQYVTIICRTTYDYTNLLERLGLEDRQSAYIGGKWLKRGMSTGRVIEYPDFLRQIGEM